MPPGDLFSSRLVDYFFYGTLLDDDVLERVLDRAVPARATDAAVLLGFARYQAIGEVYPVVVPAPAERVVGRLVSGIRSIDAKRLTAFEGPGYGQREVVVVGERRGVVTARLFVPQPSRLRPAPQAWSLDEWRRRHKRRYLEGVKIWARDWRTTSQP